MGHGHVIPNSDGSRARCGGPALCDECSREESLASSKATVSAAVYEAAVKGRQEFREAYRKLREACLKDIAGAGPMTGPIYHSEIRKALGLDAEGSGPDVIQEMDGS